MLSRLDAFQMRGLRYILKIAFFSLFEISNEEGYDEMNIILNRASDIKTTWQEFIAANRCDHPRKIEIKRICYETDK